MFLTTDVPSFSPARARALRSFAQRRRYRRYLGLSLTACAGCDARRISSFVVSASVAARRVGVLRGRTRSYEVFLARRGPLPLRMLVARDAAGRGTIVSVDHRAPAAPPPRYLGELEALEQERC
jgi:hypothetical protein